MAFTIQIDHTNPLEVLLPLGWFISNTVHLVEEMVEKVLWLRSLSSLLLPFFNPFGDTFVDVSEYFAQILVHCGEGP